MRARARLLLIGLLSMNLTVGTVAAATFDSSEKLGEALFFDPILSVNNSQSCATCHNPAFAFVDPRANATKRAVSIGADGVSLGRRNTPSLGYLTNVPTFQLQEGGHAMGGLFYDGRAADHLEQASGPIFSKIEMAMPSPQTMHERLRSSPTYAKALVKFSEDGGLDSPSQTIRMVTESLTAFQKSARFSPYDSKYDRFLRGETSLTAREEHGRLLFFSNLVNCSSCHQLPNSTTIFSDHTYHNIGTPRNLTLPAHSVDLGLAENPRAALATNRGKFRVPTLRNVAVTSPYMHNGVFRELTTVLEFYNKYLMKPGLNPETAEAWRPAEVEENISHELLKQGQPLDAYRIEALIAFLNTLTDAQFEHLIQ